MKNHHWRGRLHCYVKVYQEKKWIIILAITLSCLKINSAQIPHCGRSARCCFLCVIIWVAYGLSRWVKCGSEVRLDSLFVVGFVSVILFSGSWSNLARLGPNWRSDLVFCGSRFATNICRKMSGPVMQKWLLEIGMMIIECRVKWQQVDSEGERSRSVLCW